MRQKRHLIRQYTLLAIAVTGLLCSRTYGQVCLDPINVIYGITNAGNLHPITVSTGVVGAQINSAYTGNLPSGPNGIGYSGLTGKFYFFKRTPSSTPQEFISYDPLLDQVTILSSCPSIYSEYVGAVTPDGTAYYCWDSRSNLYYYNILADTWTLITGTFVTAGGKDVDSIIRVHGSGDIAIDGAGNMLMLPSSNVAFAVYKMNAPLPTSPVASITVTEVLPLTPPPAKFAGIALNSTGQILMSTATPNNKLYRLEDNLSLTFVADLTLDMADITSCNYPSSVLPLTFKNFTAVLKRDAVLLTWNLTANDNATGCNVEYSADGSNWEPIGTVSAGNEGGDKNFQFIHDFPAKGQNYYRIRLNSTGKEPVYSAVRKIEVASASRLSIWPNPAQQNLRINNADGKYNYVAMYDQSGRKVRESKLIEGVNQLDVNTLMRGVYVVSVQSASGKTEVQKIIKQ